jgi:GDP-mannose 6-dehydrogenase
MVELAERLLGKGYDLRIYDANVSLSRLMGANRAYIAERLPHLEDLLGDSVEEVLGHAEVCVVGCTDPAVLAALEALEGTNGADGAGVAAVAGGKVIVDLVRMPGAATHRDRRDYVGIGW